MFIYLIFANDHMFEVDFLCRFIDDLSTITVSIYLRKNYFSCQTHTITYSYPYSCQRLHLHSSKNLWTKEREILMVPITLTYPFSNLAMAHFSKVFKIQSLWSSTWSSEARWYPLGVAPNGWTTQSKHSISLLSFGLDHMHPLVEFWILCIWLGKDFFLNCSNLLCSRESKSYWPPHLPVWGYLSMYVWGKLKSVLCPCERKWKWTVK